MGENRTPQQIEDAYRRMADQGRYRPAAPSDGMGNITVPLEDLDLDAEAKEYARRWTEEENKGLFYVGVCNFSTRPSTIFAIEAARNLCGVSDGAALRLLKMAAAELEEQGVTDETTSPFT